MQILAFGDSITYGCWDEEGGWVERLKRELNKKVLIEKDFRAVIYNLGICGDRTEHLVERFQSETEQRLDPEEELYFLIAFGTNDAAYIQSEKRFRVPVEDFIANLRKVILEARVFSDNITLLTITPVNEEVVNNSEGDKIRKNEYVEQYNLLVRELVEKEQVQIIDVYDEFISRDYKNFLSPDGLHPNTKGHEVIFEQVKDHFADKF